MVEKLLTVGFHHRSRTLPGMTRFGGAHPPKNPQPPNAASLLPQNSLNNTYLYPRRFNFASVRGHAGKDPKETVHTIGTMQKLTLSQTRASELSSDVWVYHAHTHN